MPPVVRTSPRPGASVEVALAAQDQLGESPVWDLEPQILRWVDIPSGRVHALTPASGRHDSFDAGAWVGSLALRRDGGLVLARDRGFALAGADGSGLVPVPGFVAEPSGVRFNDGRVDPWGGFCAGTMDRAEQQAVGALYRLGPGLEVVRLLADVVCSNGLDWSDDRRALYYIDSATHRVDRLATDPETGRLLGREAWIQVEGPGEPDGMTLDAEGCLWVALWGGGQVRRYTPAGRLDRVLELPVSLVTSLAFGGPRLDELYVTSARDGLSPEQQGREPHAGDLFRCLPGVTGRPPHRFELPGAR